MLLGTQTWTTQLSPTSSTLYSLSSSPPFLFSVSSLLCWFVSLSPSSLSLCLSAGLPWCCTDLGLTNPASTVSTCLCCSILYKNPPMLYFFMYFYVFKSYVYYGRCVCVSIILWLYLFFSLCLYSPCPVSLFFSSFTQLAFSRMVPRQPGPA